MFSFVLILLISSSLSSPIRNCKGVENHHPIYTDPPVLLKTVKNGKLFTIGDEKMNSTWFIAHLWGTDYEMGIAYGTMLTDEIQRFINEFFNWMNNYIDTHFEFLPKWLREWVEEKGVEGALDFFYTLTEEYTPTYFYDFIRGLSESSGVDYLKYRRSMLVTQVLMMTVCTAFGAYGDATPTGDLIHLRGLDFSLDDEIIPIVYIPTIAVHHYDNSDGSNPVINIGSAGYVGSITGNSDKMSFGSKEWVNTEHSYLPIPGFPANFQSFHIMRYANTILDSVEMSRNSKRTLATFAGIGSKENFFVGMEYSPNNVTVYDWDNQTTYEYHPKFKDVVYWDKHTQPSSDPCFGDLLKNYYGEYTPELLIEKIVPLIKTGDATSTIWDYKDMMMYSSWGVDKTYACDKQYVRFDLEKVFGEQKPDLK